MLDERDEGTRYRMLETIRDYAREKLESGGRAGANGSAPLRTLLRVAKAAGTGLQGPEQADWIRAARDRSRQPARCDRAGAGGRRRPDHRGQVRRRDDGLLDVCAATRRKGGASCAQRWRLPAVAGRTVAHGHALYVGAALADSQSDHAEARHMLENCLALRRRLGNPLDIAATLSTLSLARLHLGDSDRRAHRRGRGTRALSADRQSRGRGHRPASSRPDRARRRQRHRGTQIPGRLPDAGACHQAAGARRRLRATAG